MEQHIQHLVQVFLDRFNISEAVIFDAQVTLQMEGLIRKHKCKALLDFHVDHFTIKLFYSAAGKFPRVVDSRFDLVLLNKDYDIEIKGSVSETPYKLTFRPIGAEQQP